MGEQFKLRASVTNPYSAESDLDVEEDTRSSKEFLADLNQEFHDRSLLTNQKRFYKRSGRVGSARKPMDKSNKTCFVCGKQGHFQKYYPTNKTSSPFYPSSNKTYTKPKFHTNSSSSHQHNQFNNNGQKDYRVTYKALKAELALLIQKIKVVSKNYSEKGLVAESFDYDEESLSLEDEGVIKVKAFMAIFEDEAAVGKTNARKSLRNGPPDVVFTKGENSPSETSLDVTSDIEFVNDNQEPLPHLPKLLGAKPIGTSKDVIPSSDLIQTFTVFDKTKHVTKKESNVKYVKKKAQTKTPSAPDFSPKTKADSSTKQLILTLMIEVKRLKEQIKPSSVSQTRSSKFRKGKQKAKYSPCKPQAGVTTRSKVTDSDVASSHECLYVNVPSKIEPKRVIEALEEEGWVIAMQKELNQFERNKVWTLVPAPFGKTIIGTKWIFKNKMDENCVAIKNKARIFLAYAVYMDFVVYQMDVKSAFLNGKLPKEVYVQQPHGFESSECHNYV
ncbi:retrovirus-related pol polyprotein from transposon TNT 1-94 [Tanacetum coccineum]